MHILSSQNHISNASEVEALRDAFGALLDAQLADNERIARLEAALSDLSESLSDLLNDESTRSKKPHVWSWTDLTPSELETAYRQLSAWVYDVLFVLRIETRHVILPCWFKHMNVVDELGALCKGWEYAYRYDKANPAAALEWLDRWLPNSIGRIREFMKQCVKEEARDMYHKVTQDMALTPDADLDRFISNAVAIRKTRRKPEQGLAL